MRGLWRIDAMRERGKDIEEGRTETKRGGRQKGGTKQGDT